MSALPSLDNLFPFYFPSDSRYFFMDMNAFYASVEQQERPELRGKPVIVVPLLTDDTCAIAASYEAKGLGIKTGTGVRIARMGRRELQVVEARTELYLQYHTRITDILHRYFSSVKVLSVDEMACRIPTCYNTPEKERQLGLEVKAEIYQHVGDQMRCSVGLGPNIFLSKVASDMQKPDGLTLLDASNLPEALFTLKLDDFPGIGSARKHRLAQIGVTTVEALWELSPLQMRRAWGSVVGERFWYMLRGSQQVGCDYQGMVGEIRKSVGHSHVLPPEYRSVSGAKEILLQLMSKALKRLRAYDQLASSVQVSLKYRRKWNVPGEMVNFYKDFPWSKRSRKHLHSNEDVRWMKVLRPMLAQMPDMTGRAEPLYVGITFGDLLKREDVTLNLFEELEPGRANLAMIVDGLNSRFGGYKVGLAATFEKQGVVPQRIPFGAPEESR